MSHPFMPRHAFRPDRSFQRWFRSHRTPHRTGGGGLYGWGRSVLLALMLGVATAAGAVDTPPSDALPDLAPIRALIYSGDYEKAATELQDLATRVRHADVFNLLGFSLRNLKRYDEADRWYREALYFDPTHRQAIEYQGELFIATGRLDKARENIVTLKIFCRSGCPELDTLRKAYAEAGGKE
ncbi:tetratricopeptide repeat protein [Ancylobacter sp. Lp-2]|uniref:tetratricopeptide repeat protein n=1 Tax=Ancylobacter sp. Lp-2 TaxID=2881339 RepID=UPI001E452948|nr:tetratricopeptide repeat protein [Ancylobacter sp. Lp-2]MCB4769791.1 tetratricopeptide repeat protein [Ancylobacter sp. Lp-2]